jgi:hypothetical protein
MGTDRGRSRIVAVGDQNLRMVPGPAKHFVDFRVNELVSEHDFLKSKKSD